MKHFLLFAAFTWAALGNLHAQNVGIGTTSPNGSAILDLTSTVKGFLAPRMSTGQRTGIVGPVKGLLVYDTDLNSLYHYNGSGWAAVGGGGGGFTLPFSQTVNLGIPAFQVINEGSGASLEGSSKHELGIGITAKTTGDYGFGLYAVSSKPGARSIFALADSGEVFHGENNWVGTTATLMSLVNRGIGKTVTVQLQNNTSTSANMQIAGNALGEQLLIFQTNAANSKAALSISNSGTGAGVASVANNGTGVTGTSTSGIGVIGTSTSNIGVSGVSNTNHGVKGVTNSAGGFSGVYGQNLGTAGSGVVGSSDAVNTQGVYGLSVNGIGVRANSNVYRAIQATSTSGTALFGSSTSGYSLDISGNVKIAGGNTNPATGAVLTSVDASGNAVWKTRRVAFRATGVRASQNSITDGYKRIHYAVEDFDYGNNFNVLTSDAPDANSSVFTAPVNGVYQFNISAATQGASSTDIGFANLIVRRNRNGTVSTVSTVKGYDTYSSAVIDIYDDGHFHTGLALKLNAGDKIFIEIYVDATPAIIMDTELSGFLVFED